MISYHGTDRVLLHDHVDEEKQSKEFTMVGCELTVPDCFLVAAATERCYRDDRIERLGTLYVRPGLSRGR